MDPNSNQQQVNPGQKVVSPPQNQAVNVNTVEQQTTQYQNPDIGKGKSSRAILLLVVLLIIVLGIASYLIFVNTIGNKPQSAPIVATTPSPTPVPPTPTPSDEFYIEDPEADIKAINDAASTL